MAGFQRDPAVGIDSLFGRGENRLTLSSVGHPNMRC